MNTKTIAFITALAVAGLGFAALPTLADEGDDDHEACHDAMKDRSTRGSAKDACKPAREDRCDSTDNNTTNDRCAAKQEFHSERDSARGDFRDDRDAARGDYLEEKKRLRDDYDRSNETQREEFLERQKEAREHYKDARERAREKYHDRLESAREGFVAEHRQDGKCAENEACIDKKIAKLEARKARAEDVKAHLEAKLANETADDNSTDGNATSEDFREKDRRLGLQIAILQMERHILRIDAKIADWEANKAALGEDDDNVTDLTPDNDTTDANETASDDSGDSGDDTSDFGDGSDDTGSDGNETAEQ